MRKVEKYYYKDLYEMKVIEREAEHGYIYRNVRVNKISEDNFVTHIYAQSDLNKEDTNTVTIQFKIQTISYGSLNETEWDLYINNLLESKKAVDYFKDIIKDTDGYIVIER